MHFTKIQLVGNFPPLKDSEFTFDEKINIFIGSNGTGKTMLLRCIAPSMGRIVTGWADVQGEIKRWVSQDWPPKSEEEPSLRDLNACPAIFIPASRLSMPFDNSDEVYSNDNIPLTANPQRGNYSTKEILTHILSSDMHQFDSIDVYRAIKLMYNRNQGMRAARIAMQAYKCASSISREIIDVNKAPTTYMGLATTLPTETLPENWDELDEQEKRNLRNLASPTVTHPAMGMPTSERDSTLFIGALSAGTQGVFAWILYLTLKMALFKDFEDGWERSPAILLIDEIENHLHPTWQRRVIPALLEHFPGLQIFATTHSPFVVAGRKAGQVHLLNRDTNGVVTATTNTEDIIGWTADEILRTMMGVDEPTDQLTVNRANRLRELRNQDTLSPEEETELNELRRQVNESLLSRSGPVEAQRERYSDLMQRFLLTRQSDLNQDGG